MDQNPQVNLKKKKKKKNEGESETKLSPSDLQVTNKGCKIFHELQFGSLDNEIFSVRWDPNDEYIAAACQDGSIKFYDVKQRRIAAVGSGASKTIFEPTTAVRWRPQGNFTSQYICVSVNADGTVIHWHAPTGKIMHKFVEELHSILCLDFNKDGTRFATAGRDFHIRIYDEETRTLIGDLPPADWNQKGHSNRVFALKYLTDDPNLLISGGWDSNVHMWDLREGKSIVSFHGPNLSGDGLDIYDGKILTGSYRNKEQLQVWDVKTRSVLKEVQWPGVNKDNIYVFSCQINKMDHTQFMASTSGVNEVRVFDWETQETIAIIEDKNATAYCVDYANNSKQFAFGENNGMVHIYGYH